MKITKTICGELVFGYPCWSDSINYLTDTNEIIEYGDSYYYNEKVRDRTFDNSRYMHGQPPPNNPIFTLMGSIWTSVSATATPSTTFEIGQRLTTTHPVTGDIVYFCSKGIGRYPPYINNIFNSQYYNLLFGDTGAACSVFNTVSCATWTGITNPSTTNNVTNFSVTNPTVTASGISIDQIPISVSTPTRVINKIQWGYTFK